jgi:hypothetical protein
VLGLQRQVGNRAVTGVLQRDFFGDDDENVDGGASGSVEAPQTTNEVGESPTFEEQVPAQQVDVVGESPTFEDQTGSGSTNEVGESPNLTEEVGGTSSTQGGPVEAERNEGRTEADTSTVTGGGGPFPQLESIALANLRASGGSARDEPFVTAMCSAINGAMSQWKSKAMFTQVVINGPTALGGPGCLFGPALAPLIGGLAPTGGAAGQAVARGIGASFATWQRGVVVPGLPWYPSFAAFPGPQAPPLPNVPSTLIQLPSSGLGIATSPAAILGAMGRSDPASRAIAIAFSQSLLIWISSQMVSLVFGTGPVPTFAPPFVPVGPVVGGTVLATPGHLAS